MPQLPLTRAARIIFVGPPGVGKGTQTERLMARFPQIRAIGSGDLLRENVRMQTPLGMMADAAMRQGKLVPDHLMIRLIMGELKRRGWVTDMTPAAPLILSSTAATAVRDIGDDEDDGYVTGGGMHNFASAAAAATIAVPETTASPTTPTTSATAAPAIQASDDPAASFILDGFPRTLAQAQQLDALAPPNLVVELCTPAHLILARIGGRMVHAPSGRVYHAAFSPPRVPGRDDATGEPLTRRADDDVATWRARLASFERASRPLLAHYARRGVMWRVRGDSSDEISPRLFAEVARRFAAGAAGAAGGTASAAAAAAVSAGA